jgi:ubiquinone/menaquinone biosynthesis C-methylase UbiE
LYDPLTRWLFRADSIRQRLIAAADLHAGYRVLDVGCGTATLTLLVKKLQPETEVTGLDGDPKALAIARRKAEKAGLEVRFDEGLSDDLPYPDRSFDRVVSSFVFHHLTREQKSGTLLEVLRVLETGGTLHLLDFGKPGDSLVARIATHLFHRGERSRDNLEGALPALLRDAGFQGVEEYSRQDTILGSLSFYRASR